ncbi:MAG: YihY family inner membrane protein [Pseudoxanthomonas sp.]
MPLPPRLEQWTERARDPARVSAFGRFLWRRFLDDRLFQAAAALAYTTIFALAPLAMVVFAVLSAFPSLNASRDALVGYILDNFVPHAVGGISRYLPDGTEGLGSFTAAGVLALVVSVLVTLNSVETTFNRIWRVPLSRPRLGRFLVYWTVLTLGTLLAAAWMSLMVSLFALPLFHTHEGQTLARFLLAAMPVLIELGVIAALYWVVPHRPIHWRYACAGALVATVLLELLKWGFGLYLAQSGAYTRIYRSLAVLPITLVWIYLTWVSVLLGASLASAVSAFRYQPPSLRLPAGYEMYGLLRLLGRFQLARRHGRGLSDDGILRLEPLLTDALVQQFLAQLCAIGVLRNSEDGQWLLARDLADVSLGELYEAAQLRVPAVATALPCQDDALGQVARQALERLRRPLREQLQIPVSALFDAIDDSQEPSACASSS